MNTNWTTKDRLGLLVIPVELLISVLIFKVFFKHLGPNIALIINLVIFGLGFCIMLYLFGSVLKAQFHQYKKRLWLKLLLNIGLTLGAYGVLSFTRGLMGTSLEANPLESITYGSLFVMIAASIQPLLAPFAEELTFRYLLFMKIKPGVLKLIMFFVSSILFGLIHYFNFNGSVIDTVPYMIVGAYFALICYFFKNIWGSIFTHFFFNATNSFFPAILLLLAKLIS
ncbi:CPBP family intramembrane glutamic endopeptidase [uncultured Enterococcus sp.]|uniref:CPBP family intramembrane glutamic endopeptidase n=1 Tax=uncultured Enterococcus sp. TaxID=167972 RepID=UPI0025DB11AE|nr:type II CAAX endopeptidase family protein [uncultured Enterococcus sp.]